MAVRPVNAGVQAKIDGVAPMPDCTVQEELFGRVGRRRVEVGFDGGEVTSDAGLLLIRKADEQIGLLERVAAVLPDPRDRRANRTWHR